jgi:hypothetical protein
MIAADVLEEKSHYYNKMSFLCLIPLQALALVQPNPPWGIATE